MARTKSQPAELIPDVALNPELEATQNLIATVSSQMNDERDLLNQLLGQAQMAGAFEDFSRTVRTSKLAFVKENKLYRNLKDAKIRTVRKNYLELGKSFAACWAGLLIK